MIFVSLLNQIQIEASCDSIELNQIMMIKDQAEDLWREELGGLNEDRVWLKYDTEGEVLMRYFFHEPG